MAVETFANAPTPSIPSTAWTTLAAGIDASVTSLTVVAFTSFPSAAQYRILIDNELLLVTAGGGTTTWTVTRGVEGSTAATHASGANVFHTLTAAGLARHPRSMTTAGDTEYLGSTGAPTRLAAPGTTGSYVTTWVSGVPSWTSVAVSLREARFGVVGDGVANDTAAWAAFLTAAAGGIGYVPPGRYLVTRNYAADNMTTNTRIIGAGASSVIVNGYVDASALNHFYNAFAATSQSNIEIAHLAVEGFTACTFIGCSNVSVHHITASGWQNSWMRSNCVYLENCARSRVSDNDFTDYEYSVYLSGATSTRCDNTVVANNTFAFTKTVGQLTSLFPVGVYVYFGDNTVISGNTFRNIYSSFDNGSTGTGMGYGVYEGDGAAGTLNITGNIFEFANGYGNKRAIAVLTSTIRQCDISGNSIHGGTTSKFYCGMWIQSNASGSVCTIANNGVVNENTAATGYGVYLTQPGTYTGSSFINSNTIKGFLNGMRQDGAGTVRVSITNNTITDCVASGLQFLGEATIPIKHLRIVGNTIARCQTNGVLLGGYCVSTQILGNSILDNNLSNGTGAESAAIHLSGYSFGLTLIGNLIGNTAYGGGLSPYGVTNGSNVTDRIFKDITSQNTFIGINVVNRQFDLFPTVSPTVGIFDVEYAETVENVTLNAGGIPGWRCVYAKSQLLTANASSASTTVTVASTSGYVALDIVLLCKDANPYDADYYTWANWHADTIASVTNGTSFVLTTGIPAGDGTYASGTGLVKVARFRALAAIAA